MNLTKYIFFRRKAICKYSFQLKWKKDGEKKIKVNKNKNNESKERTPMKPPTLKKVPVIIDKKPTVLPKPKISK